MSSKGLKLRKNKAQGTAGGSTVGPSVAVMPEINSKKEEKETMICATNANEF